MKILDTTLRDGSYVNDANFGYNTIKDIIKNLQKANIDIIEVGWLEDCQYNKDRSFFSCVSQIPCKGGVALTRLGKLDINNLKEYDGTSIDGIRVAFHNNEWEEGLEFCKKVKEKGYKVFVQPVGTTSYSDDELIKLIEEVNKISPYAFYIVDTLGMIIDCDLMCKMQLVKKYLHKSIMIGFHSHNNLQLSFSNVISLIGFENIIVDASVMGMGRGAGNLPTELICNYLTGYNINPILEIAYNHILPIKNKLNWGYSIEYFLTAINNCHPNYADAIKDLNYKELNEKLKGIPEGDLFNASNI